MRRSSRGSSRIPQFATCGKTQHLQLHVVQPLKFCDSVYRRPEVYELSLSGLFRVAQMITECVKVEHENNEHGESSCMILP